MSKIKNENFVVIHGWMINELNLKGNELLIYAAIYGFSQDEENQFTGSLQYLADWTNSTKRSVLNCIKSLLDKRLLEKEENTINGVKFCKYKALYFHQYRKKFTGGMEKSSLGGMEKSSPNNIDIYNIANNIESIDKAKRFAPPALEDVQQYVVENGYNVDAERFIDYYNANGWKVGKNTMKDWKAAVRNWNRREQGQATPKQQNSFKRDYSYGVEDMIADMEKELEQQEAAAKQQKKPYWDTSDLPF